MDINEWKKKNDNIKRYAHFDGRVSLSRAWGYITDPEKVAQHSFYPFIHYQKHFDKYSKKDGVKHKERELCYSAHLDRCIYQYYGYKLNQKYNDRVIADGINNVAIAYRDNLKKNNIHFAKEAFDFIKKNNDCYIIVGDFTKFFDRLDHKYLKRRLADLLNEKLPNDYYAVYKNIIKFSIWDLNSLLSLNGLSDSFKDRKKLNNKERVLSLSKFKKNKANHVKTNPNNYGIPQGSAISAIFSNIYMLEFDKIINDYVKLKSGLFMRYSDDFIVIFPNTGENDFCLQLKFIFENINDIDNLELQADKTQAFKFENGNLICCTKTFVGVENSNNFLNYLGFTFDGKKVMIRDKTLSKYYYRLYRKLRTIIDNDGFTPNGNRISCKKLYQKYSYKGANVIDTGKNIRQGNFITYVQRAEAIFGNTEAINQGIKKHMQKIRNKLNQI